MRRFLVLTVLIVGCKKAAQETPASAPAAAVLAAATTPETPVKKPIEAGRPEFDVMLADFKADPKTTKYERDIPTFVMTVESVKEIDKQKYIARGTGDGLNLVCTFILPPNLPLNSEARTLGPGDKVTYLAGVANYKPGTPPTITGLSGSIISVTKK